MFRRDRGGDPLGRDRTGAERDADGGGGRDGDELRIGDRPEIDEPHTVGVARQQCSGGFRRQSRFADAARSGQRDESRAVTSSNTVWSAASRPISSDSEAGRFVSRDAGTAFATSASRTKPANR